MTAAMTILQARNVRVTLKMFGTPWVADFGGYKIVEKVHPEVSTQNLHVESCQFSVQHYGKLSSIPLCIRVDRPASQIDVEIIKCRLIHYRRKDLCPRYLL